ncbi:hypothetical protein [Paenibacillus thalictri]|nr:hypothetical protein [Paenibacillus thalictri]
MYSKKLIASAMALTILLGGGLAYGSAQQAFAEDTNSANQQQTQSKKSEANSGELKQKFGKRQMSKRKEGNFPIVSEAAEILGMDKDALDKALETKTLTEIAKEKGISEDDLVAKLQAERSKKIDEAVQSGKIPADKAEKLKASMSKHLRFMVNKPNLHQMDRERFMKKHPMFFHGVDNIAGILGMTKEELKTELKSGKSITEIAAAKGIAKEDLIAKIKEQMTPVIEKMIDRKKETK